MKKVNFYKVGYMDVPLDYIKYDKETQDVFCNNLIDDMLMLIENELSSAPEINRVGFLISIMESSLITNEQLENYEICAVIKNCLKLLND